MTDTTWQYPWINSPRTDNIPPGYPPGYNSPNAIQTEYPPNNIPPGYPPGYFDKNPPTNPQQPLYPQYPYLNTNQQTASYPQQTYYMNTNPQSSSYPQQTPRMDISPRQTPYVNTNPQTSSYPHQTPYMNISPQQTYYVNTNPQSHPQQMPYVNTIQQPILFNTPPPLTYTPQIMSYQTTYANPIQQPEYITYITTTTQHLTATVDQNKTEPPPLMQRRIHIEDIPTNIDMSADQKKNDCNLV